MLNTSVTWPTDNDLNSVNAKKQLSSTLLKQCTLGISHANKQHKQKCILRCSSHKIHFLIRFIGLSLLFITRHYNVKQKKRRIQFYPRYDDKPEESRLHMEDTWKRVQMRKWEFVGMVGSQDNSSFPLCIPIKVIIVLFCNKYIFKSITVNTN